MSAKKPLLPPGSRWKTLDKTHTPTSLIEDDDPQDYSQEATPQLTSPTGNTNRVKLSSSPGSPRSRTLHTRWRSSDDLLEIKNTSTLPRSYESVDEENSPICNRPSPPIRPQNGSLVSGKPLVVPRKMQTSPQGNRTKPPLPRKPRTVYATNRTGPAIPPKPRPPPTPKKLSGLLKKSESPALNKEVQPEFKNSTEHEPITDKPKLPSGLLKKFNSTEGSHPLAKISTGNGVTSREPLELPKKTGSPNRDLHPQSKDFTDHAVVKRNRERVTEKNLEKCLMKGKVASKQTASPVVGSERSSDRPLSMIIASPVSFYICIAINMYVISLIHKHMCHA